MDHQKIPLAPKTLFLCSQCLELYYWNLTPLGILRHFSLLKSLIKLQRHLGKVKTCITNKNLKSLKSEKMT